jgi:hypothetical protein
MSSEPKSYFIQYGFLGGALHSRGLEHALKNHGYVRAKTIQTADVLICHSAGYYLLPPNISPPTVMLVAPALPGSRKRSAYIEADKQIWKSALKNSYLLKRLLWSYGSIYYGLRHPLNNRRIMSNILRENAHLPHFKKSTVLFIANKDDPWPLGPQLPDIIATRPWIFLNLPGIHEMLWEYPETYLEVLDRYAK